MRLVAATLYALEIPFVESFRHSAKQRAACDSVVVRVRDEVGTQGFGEGCPRPYVTGETVELMLDHIVRDLWPEVAERELPSLEDAGSLGAVDKLLPRKGLPAVLSDNASRAALELAILDCILRRQGVSLARLLPPLRPKVVYSGVITAGSPEGAAQRARQMRQIGLSQVKVKVGIGDDLARVRAVREALGPEASLRVDANGAWTWQQAVSTLAALASFDIAAAEQPLPRGPARELKALRQACPVPLMADESLVTLEDAEALVAEQAVDFFNVRISKCGGLHRSLQIATLAAGAGVRVQVGCQVGETAILSSAGRHLAAALPEVAFVEGSYGTLLLTEDVSADGVCFGHRGEAGLLTGPGLGARVLPERLRKYACRLVELPLGRSQP